MKNKLPKIIIGSVATLFVFSLLNTAKVKALWYLVFVPVLFFFCWCGGCAPQGGYQSVCSPECSGKCGGAADTCGGACWGSCSAGLVCSGQTCMVPTPTITPYPTIKIAGSLKNDLSRVENRCSDTFTYPSSLPYTPILTLNPGGAGSSYACSAISNGQTTYTCYITLNNQTNQSISPVQTVSLSNTGYPGGLYKTYWIGPCTTNNCAQTTDCQQRNQTITVNASLPSPYFDKNLYLSPDEGWFKMKGTTYSLNNSSQRNNIIPQSVTAYDSDDTTSKQLIIGNAGLTSLQSSLDLVNTTTYSDNNWVAGGYETKKMMTNTTAYIDYLKQKSDEFTTITDVSQIGTSTKKIFMYNSNLTIDNAALTMIDKKNLTLIVNGDVDFNLGDGGSFTPTNSIVLIAKKIMFYNKTTPTTPNTNWLGVIKTAQGVFIADSVDLGTSIDIGIKIKGNLISLGGAVANLRKQSDYTIPSVFIVFDPKIYIDTIGVFGSKTYDWSEQ